MKVVLVYAYLLHLRSQFATDFNIYIIPIYSYQLFLHYICECLGNSKCL